MSNMQDFKHFYDTFKESQSFLGMVQFVVMIVSVPFFYGFTIDYYRYGHELFQCEDNSGLNKINCYRNYREKVKHMKTCDRITFSHLQFNMVFLVIPLIMGIISALMMEKIRSARREGKQLFIIYFSQLLLRLTFFSVCSGVFAACQDLKPSLGFECTLETGRKINCSDYKAWSKYHLNVAAIAVQGAVILLALIELCYLFCKFDFKFPANENFLLFLKGEIFKTSFLLFK